MSPKLAGILSDVTAFLTLIAALPYELGAVADILPPDWKKWVAIAGAVATLILRSVKRVQTPDAGPPANSAPISKPLVVALLCAASLSLTGCPEYEGHVAARQDSLSGYAKDGGYGGALTHRVEFDR